MKDSKGCVDTTTAAVSETETIKCLLNLKTEALFAYLNAVQDLNKQIRLMKIEEELSQITRNFDKALAEVLLREGK